MQDPWANDPDRTTKKETPMHNESRADRPSTPPPTSTDAKTYRLQVTIDVTTKDEQDVFAVDSEIAEAIGKIDGHPDWAGVKIELVDSDSQEI